MYPILHGFWEERIDKLPYSYGDLLLIPFIAAFPFSIIVDNAFRELELGADIEAQPL
jgi:hypothetical protein